MIENTVSRLLWKNKKIKMNSSARLGKGKKGKEKLEKFLFLAHILNLAKCKCVCKMFYDNY